MPANTSPDNIQFPTAGDQIAPLNTVFQNLAQTTQTALTRRVVANVADFTALAALSTTGKLAGDLAYVVEGAVYMSWSGSAWVQRGVATFASTSVRDTAYAKAGAVYRVAGVRALDTSTGVESQRGASAWVLDYQVYASPISASAGFTITLQSARRSGKVVTLAFTATKSSTWGSADQIGTVIAELSAPNEIVFGLGVENSDGALRGASVDSIRRVRFYGTAGRPGANSQIGSITYVIA